MVMRSSGPLSRYVTSIQVLLDLLFSMTRRLFTRSDSAKHVLIGVMTMPEVSNSTHYDLLGLSSSASREEIKEAYHKLARKLHPDKQSHQVDQSEVDQSDIDFKRIQQAWETLRNAEQRKCYDDDLQQQELRLKSRSHGALEISVSDLEQAIDEENDETFHVYDCRCGEEVIISNWDQSREMFVDCDGCCFVYKLCPT
eukprot:scaffold1525_cov142-Cylindrotheca_fusiformis.AAC.70